MCSIIMVLKVRTVQTAHSENCHFSHPFCPHPQSPFFPDYPYLSTVANQSHQSLVYPSYTCFSTHDKIHAYFLISLSFLHESLAHCIFHGSIFKSTVEFCPLKFDRSHLCNYQGLDFQERCYLIIYTTAWLLV